MVSEDVELELLNAKHDLADMFLSRRDNVEKWGRSPQGSCCIYQSNIQENVDASKACIHKLVIPPNAKINHVRIWCYGEKYRCYETGIEAGGAVEVSTEATAPGPVTSGSSSKTTNDATTPETQSSSVDDILTGSETAHTHSLTVFGYTTGAYQTYQRPRIGGSTEDLIYNMVDIRGHYHVGGGTSHNHTMAHTHIAYGVSHQHGMLHTHQVDLTHTHNVSIDDHVHDLAFGIYEAASATAQISLVITDPDGTPHDLGVLGTGEFAEEDLEVTEYFSKTGVYTFTFSSDALGRVRSIVFTQIYVEPD